MYKRCPFLQVNLGPDKRVVDLTDPNRPRFTLQELRDVLQERNKLKSQLLVVQEELQCYKRWALLPWGSCSADPGPVWSYLICYLSVLMFVQSTYWRPTLCRKLFPALRVEQETKWEVRARLAGR